MITTSCGPLHFFDTAWPPLAQFEGGVRRGRHLTTGKSQLKPVAGCPYVYQLPVSSAGLETIFTIFTTAPGTLIS
jgi:hypothetical protein